MKSVAVLVCGAILAFTATTWWALEWSGVAVLRTERADGSLRQTHVWCVEHEGSVWIEAATPEREFLADLRRAPDVVLSVDHRTSHYRAEPVAEPSGHDVIRRLLRRKYGLRDRWIGLLQDTSRSVAVRLYPS